MRKTPPSGGRTVKTSKTGETVDIPLFPLLRAEIEKRAGNGDEYVFPEQAEKYMANPGFLTDRLRKVLAAAGFHNGETEHTTLDPEEVDSERVRAEAHRVIDNMRQSPRRERMARMIDAYLDGASMNNLRDQFNVSKAVVSRDLNELETKTGLPFIRGKARDSKPRTPSRGAVNVERSGRMNRASVRDFHAFRTTWITLALTSNIPIELVKRVTGHKTVDIVLRHYFRPQREQLKKALQEHMPALLTDGMGSKIDQVAALLRAGLDGSTKELREAAIAAVELLEGK